MLFSDPAGRRPAAIPGWVFYDAECSFCASLVRWLEPMLLRRGFHCSPLQDRWVALALGIPRHELLLEMRVWTPKRELLGGADAVIYLAGRIWWAWPLYAIAQLPAPRELLWVAYRWVAVHRHCHSACAQQARSERRAA